MRKKWWKQRWFSVPVMGILVFLILIVAIYFLLRELPFDSDWFPWVQWGIPAAIAIIMMVSRLGKKRDFEGIEHGSARWGTRKEWKPFEDKEFSHNIILSATEFLSMSLHGTRRNRHVAVIGGSGTGKGQSYAIPNACQMNGCYIITDPSGEHIAAEGEMMEKNGYSIRTFNVCDFSKSMHFNPFIYFTSVSDVRSFVEILMANTKGEGEKSGEDFWVKAERLWFMSHIAYLMETLPKEEVNIPKLLDMLTSSQTKEEGDDFTNPVDILFEDLEQENPRSFAVQLYHNYKLAAGKTAKSILISVSARMTDFYIPEIADLFADDELHLEELGKKKTAYFLIMDETKSVYNYMVAILVDTMINCMSNCAKDCPGKALPIPVRCLLDEILNIGKFPSLDRWTRTLRKYNIGLEMMIQDMAGGEDTYGEKQWSSIVGNCDTIVFLGSKEPHTIKFVSEQLLGDTTIETVSYGGNGGSGGIGNNSYSQNRQAQSRKLMDAAEVSKMGNNECLVSLRGINVFRSKKYNLKKHPNYHLLADRKSPGYTYIRDEIQLDEIQYVTMINCNTVAE